MGFDDLVSASQMAKSRIRRDESFDTFRATERLLSSRDFLGPFLTVKCFACQVKVLAT